MSFGWPTTRGQQQFMHTFWYQRLLLTHHKGPGLAYMYTWHFCIWFKRFYTFGLIWNYVIWLTHHKGPATVYAHFLIQTITSDPPQGARFGLYVHLAFLYLIWDILHFWFDALVLCVKNHVFWNMNIPSHYTDEKCLSQVFWVKILKLFRIEWTSALSFVS